MAGICRNTTQTAGNCEFLASSPYNSRPLLVSTVVPFVCKREEGVWEFDQNVSLRLENRSRVDLKWLRVTKITGYGVVVRYCFRENNCANRVTSRSSRHLIGQF